MAKRKKQKDTLRKHTVEEIVFLRRLIQELPDKGSDVWCIIDTTLEHLQKVWLQLSVYEEDE